MEAAARDATGEPDAVDVVQRAHRTMDKIERMTGAVDASSGNRNDTNITVSAGGIGVWLCVSACAVMFVLTVVVGMLFLDLSRKYDRMQDHLSAIYMMAPQLKPKE